ncbi:hypothetical protein UFOVP1290_417 [uncultured Caudovirales phage]|uniref:Uncharacterized protein n=1 Tax=uncultured Caudovirales phage TaxID=2100421 RepID=A0A6J5RRJ0_9CAUD|nr:hypothetical protein UFOVP1290_417 [uncultured Caudovirales phage]
MSEFIYRDSELLSSEGVELIDLGYNEFHDNSCDEKYYFDPKHWKLSGNNEKYDYIFDDVYFVSLTDRAKELALSEGYGELFDKPTDI